MILFFRAFPATACAVLLLGACAGTPPPAETPPSAESAAPESVETETPDTAAPEPAAPETAAVPATKPRRPVRLPAPESLIDISAEQVRLKLGQPDFRRIEGKAEIWQYRGQICSLDLFLFPGNADLTVRHTELRDRTGGDAARAICLEDIAQSRPRQESG